MAAKGTAAVAAVSQAGGCSMGLQERSVDSERLMVRLALAHSTALRPVDRRRLDERLRDTGELLRLGWQEAAAVTRPGLRESSWQPQLWMAAAEADLGAIARGRLSCIGIDDSEYPQMLAVTHDAPRLLFYRGTLPRWDRPMVAVVGTRRPTGRGRTAAFLVGYELARLGLAVVSGLAIGIDRLAHEGVMRAGGIAVAVLGNGIDRVFPASSAPLGRAILAAGGCLMSEYPPGAPAGRHHFPARNRIVSGLCRALVIVQAPQRSGALITADYALGEGRDLYVHRAGVEGAQSAGTRDLAESGARVIRSAREIVADWGWPLPPEAPPEAGGLAASMEAELAGRGGQFNGVFFDASGRALDG